MAHTIRNKKELLNRVRRLQGQLAGVERALEAEHECDDLLHRLAACRGALASLTAEVIEGHVRFHIVNPDTSSERSQAARQLVEVVRKYLR
jgi:DNA-binding FrmR family transcriptional regulator